ncbi:MAG TPA: transcription termination/antitermination protein NusG [Armatimonadota bacterium]|jgi:transcriptional antiterminator NusG
MEWFVVHTLTGKENKVKTAIEKSVEARELHHLLGRILIPTETEIRSTGGKRREIKRKLYPGYVLVEMEMGNDMRHLIQETAGVTHFLTTRHEESLDGTKDGPREAPVPLSPAEIDAMLRRVGEEGQKPKAVWTAGDAVRITEGPFAEFSGKITEVNIERETVKVLISIFGRETPVEVDFTQIEKI